MLKRRKLENEKSDNQCREKLEGSSNEEEESVETPPEPCQVVVVALPNSSFKDRNHLLNIFPPEVWSLVFEKLTNPAHLENVSNSSLFFRDLLLSRRQQFLFWSVWKIIAKAPEILFSEETRHDNQENSSHLLQVVKLRLVCSMWRNVIDCFYQSAPIYFEKLQGFIQEIKVDIRRSSGKFSSFLAHFAQTHGNTCNNPFIGRSIMIIIEHRLEEARQKILEVLGKYGHHIYHCKLVLSGNGLFPNGDTTYSRISELLRLMPNIRGLTVTGTEFIDERESLYEISSKPLPKLVHLQSLTCSRDLSLSLYKELIRCYNDIKTLGVHLIAVTSRDSVTESLLPQLKTLKIRFSDDEQLLPHLSSLNSPLTKLHLDCASGDWFPWLMVYAIIARKFKETLKYLHVILEDVSVVFLKNVCDTFSKHDIYKLDLPHLSHLKLKLYYLTDLNFLLPLKNTLKTLDLCADIRGEDRPTLNDNSRKYDCINVFQCASRNRPLEMNIWDVLPELKWFTFKFNDNVKSLVWSYSRQEWLQKVKDFQEPKSTTEGK